MQCGGSSRPHSPDILSRAAGLPTHGFSKQIDKESGGRPKKCVYVWGGAPMGLQWGKMGEHNLSDFVVFSYIFNNTLLYFWGFNYSKMAN